MRIQDEFGRRQLVPSGPIAVDLSRTTDVSLEGNVVGLGACDDT